MKEITLRIPDKKFNFFIELMRHLGFEIAEESVISEKHKTIVRERIKTSKPEKMIPLKEARRQLSLRGKK